MPGASHAACTVEMASVTRGVEVAVVDEVQMLGDGSRGHAFTRALLGLPAATLHLCGDAAALPLLRQLVADAGAATCCPPQSGVTECQALYPLECRENPFDHLSRRGPQHAHEGWQPCSN